MKLDPNAPAYPVLSIDSWNKPWVSGGLTVRQDFAKAAMEGFCANPACDTWDAAKTARVSAEYADALIAELNKEQA